ncbi:MAG: LysE family transporter [Bacteroidota bacterium]
MFLHLGFGLVLSIIGTLPLGIINLTVAERTIHKGLAAGLWIAFGATLVEMVQILIAVKFAYLFTNNPVVNQWLQILAIPVFFGLALYFLLQKERSEFKSEEQQLPDFAKGMAISVLNLLAIPYWLFYGSYLHAEGHLGNNLDFLGLCIGAFIGTMLVLWLYGKMGLMVLEKMQMVAKVTNRLLAALLFLFGLIQLLRVVMG